MRRIVFVDQCLDAGGAERVMCTIMRMLDPAKFDIHLILVTELRTFRYLVPREVKIHELGIKKTSRAFFLYSKIIRELKPDIVFSTSKRTTILSILTRPFSGRFKIVSRYSTTPSLIAPNNKFLNWRSIIEKNFYKRADYVIAQTEQMAREICHYYRIPMEKVVTILNPVDIIYINDCLKNSKNPYSPETLNIVAVGTLYPPKGFDTLILAFGIIAREFENCNLWVIGRDHENNEALLRRQAERLGVSNKVNFLGFKKNPYVYMKYADLFVLSSRREGLPNVLLEAKYLGCKAVGTNCVEVISTLLKPKFVSLVDDAENLASVMNKALTCDEPTFSSNDFNGDLIGFLERITVKSKPV